MSWIPKDWSAQSHHDNIYHTDWGKFRQEILGWIIVLIVIFGIGVVINSWFHGS